MNRGCLDEGSSDGPKVKCRSCSPRGEDEAETTLILAIVAKTDPIGSSLVRYFGSPATYQRV